MGFSLSGGVEVYGFIAPTDIVDTYPVIDPLYGIDGFRNVNALTDLNLIPIPRRRAGMVVGVGGGTTYYKLNPSPWSGTLTDWTQINLGNGVSIGVNQGGGSEVFKNINFDTIFFRSITGGTNVTASTLGDLIVIDANDVYVTGGTSTGSTNESPNATIELTYNEDVPPGTYSLQYKDTFITGFTYNNNNFTLKDNSGNTFVQNISVVTGLTINGDLNITGNTNQIGNINLTGNTRHSGDTIQTGNFHITGNTSHLGNSSQTGNTNQLGNLTLGGNASVYNLSAITLTFDTTYTGSTPYGVMAWNPDFGVPQVGMVGGNVVQKIGESVYAYVKNADTTPLTKGEVVYIFGASGDKMTVKRASASGDTTSSKTLGVVAEPIGVNQLGYVITQGTLDGLNLGSYTAGDIVWLSTVAGQFTNVKRYAPTHLVFIGVVQRANNGNGQLYVKPQNGYEMEELHDVMSTGATYGDILVYSAYSGYNVWVSTKVLTGNYTFSGNTNQIGNFNITGNTIQSGNTTQIGNHNLTGNTNQLGYLHIVSATTGCTLAVTGTTCLTGPFNVTGATFMSGNFCMNNMNTTGQTGTNCLDTTLIPTGTTVIHSFQGQGGVLAHLGDLSSGEPNSKGYIYMENNAVNTPLPNNSNFIKMSGTTTTIPLYLNLFNTGTTDNELVYTYTASTGSSITYLKYNISYTAQADSNSKSVNFALARIPYPYTATSYNTLLVPATMTNWIQQSNQPVTGTLTGIVGATYLDKFVFVLANGNPGGGGGGGAFNVKISDFTMSLFT